MQLKITFRKPGRGVFKVLFTPPERIQVSRGMIRRIPPDKDYAFNSIPLKLVTSIRFVDNTKSRCGICKVVKEPLICVDCIKSVFTKKEPTRD